MFRNMGQGQGQDQDQGQGQGQDHEKVRRRGAPLQLQMFSKILQKTRWAPGRSLGYPGRPTFFSKTFKILDLFYWFSLILLLFVHEFSYILYYYSYYY